MRASAAASLMLISIHALREEGDDKIILDTLTIAKFLSTPSARRATLCENFNGMTDDISIHALREEGDFPFSSRQTCFIQFLSTPSARRATIHRPAREPREADFYPRPPRGGRQRLVIPMAAQLVISIHALREEGDFPFSSRQTCFIQFLSTPSARRATIHRPAREPREADFYPRPPRGGRQRLVIPMAAQLVISIHALREEGDFWMLSYCCCKTISIHALREEGDHPAGILPDSRADFYPRPPRGGRQRDVLGTFATPGISIHALREEGDRRNAMLNLVNLEHFYPRPPRGGRLQSAPTGDATAQNFYPRPPRGGRPKTGGWTMVQKPISIHALREEGDLGATIDRLHRAIFLSTPSARRATPPEAPAAADRLISIHALREEGDKNPSIMVY